MINLEYLLHERSIDISHETVGYWWNRFGPHFATEIRRRRATGPRACPIREADICVIDAFHFCALP